MNGPLHLEDFYTGPSIRAQLIQPTDEVIRAIGACRAVLGVPITRQHSEFAPQKVGLGRNDERLEESGGMGFVVCSRLERTDTIQSRWSEMYRFEAR